MPSETLKHRSTEAPSPLALVTLVVLWAWAVYRLGTLWYGDPNYSYGWFMPLLCLALAWERWKCRPAPSPVRASSGTLVFFALLALALLPLAFSFEILPHWRLIISSWRSAGWLLAGCAVGLTFIICYLVGGRSWCQHFAFPVLFFLVAVPWPWRVEQPLILTLTKLNSAISTFVVNILGTPAIREGALIATGAGLVGVDQACSGIRSFQSSVMISLFLGELFRYSFLRRLAFLVGGVALAFTCNVVRTTYLVRICDLKGKDAIDVYHDKAGFTILGITLVGLLVLAWLLSKKKSDARGQTCSRQ